MNSSRAIDIIYAGESRADEMFSRVVDLLTPHPLVTELLDQSQKLPGGERFKALWQESSKSAERFRVERRITDWVFENFWMNPHEPRHSKLLAYFIKPDEEHGCGEFLLTKFCEGLNKPLKKALKNENVHIRTDCLRHCKVDAEIGRIDVSITCDCVDPKWTVIIENKINNAKNQDRQLERYVRLRCKEGYKRIFVFYLPRSSDKDPDLSELKALKDLEVEFLARIFYVKITFEQEILSWLNSALKNWPKSDKDLREHFSYYRRLVVYLVNLNKQNKMDSAILNNIQQEEEKRGHLTLKVIDDAIISALSLKRVFERVLRGRLLRRIYDALRKRDLDPHFYDILEWPKLRRVNPESDYAPEFEELIIVAIEVTSAISVGYGWEDETPGFFFGYFRLNDEHGQFDDLVQREALSLFVEIDPMDNKALYYASKSENLTPEQCQEEKTAAHKVMKICEMQERLQQELLTHTAN